MSDEISDALNLEPMPGTSLVRVDAPENVNRDFDYARDNLYLAIEAGNKALEELVQIASSSQHPRAFEVLAATIKTLADVNGQLLDLQKKRKDLEDPDQPAIPGDTHNHLHITTADLQQLVKKMEAKTEE